VYDSHLPCHAPTMLLLLKATAHHARRETAVLCRGFENNGMVRAWHGRGTASVNQTRLQCVNQMGKTHSKPLATWHGRGTAWARHAMCESALMPTILVNKASWNTCNFSFLFCGLFYDGVQTSKSKDNVAGRTIGGWWFGKGLEGRDGGLIEVTYQ